MNFIGPSGTQRVYGIHIDSNLEEGGIPKRYSCCILDGLNAVNKTLIYGDFMMSAIAKTF